MLSLGGYMADSERFSAMVSDPQRRTEFVQSVVPFLNRFGFEGLDLDWNWPGMRQESNHNSVNPDDRDNLSLLIQELSAEMKANQKWLSMVLFAIPDDEIVNYSYDLDELSKYVDYFTILAFDYHAYHHDYHEFTGHLAPLYYVKDENKEGHPGYERNAYSAMEYFVNKPNLRPKLLLGIPAYGRGFVLSKEDKNGLYCPARLGMPVVS